MKAYVLSFVAMITCASLWGQTVKAYPDVESFKNDKPIMLEHVTITRRTDFDISMNEGGAYKITAEDKSTNKKLKFQYWAIEADSLLYINTVSLSGNMWYAPVMYRSPDFLYFRLVGKKHGSAPVAAGALAFGVVGAIAAAGVTQAVSHPSKSEYLMYIDWGEPMPLNEKSFSDLLKMRKDTALLRQYGEEEEPTSYATYIKYLKVMGKKQL